MAKPKPLSPKNIKFSPQQIAFVKKIASAQGHDNFSKVIKSYVDRAMQGAA